MGKHHKLTTVPEAKKAAKRPKTLVIKSVSTGEGGKRRVFALDANSASFGEDFLYVFKANVKLARRKSRERKAAGAGGHRGA